MRRISFSEIRTYNMCREEHRFAYADKIRPITQDWQLRFGKAVHEALASWWGTLSLEVTLKEFSRAVAREQLDPFDLELGEAMLTGYDAQWRPEHESITTLWIEKPFTMQRHLAVEPYALVGIIDAAAEREFPFVVEHKTTSEDISSGSDYWAKLVLDQQISIYALAAPSLGLEPSALLYDVLRVPSLKPLKATPPETRKYTKTGSLYANQRDRDETPYEFRVRILEDMNEKPESYFGRAQVVRLEHELKRALREVDTIAADIMRSEPGVHQPLNPDACKRFGRRCAYWTVCTQTESIDSDRFVRIGGSR